MWPIASFPGEKRQSRLAPVPAQTPRAVGAARVPAPRRSTWECTEHSTRRRDAQQRPAKRSSSGASPKPHQSGRSRRARAAPKALRLRAAPQGTQERFRTRGDVIPRRREAPGVDPRRPEALCRGPPPVLSAPCIRGCRGFLILYSHETRRRRVRPALTQHTQIRSLYKTSISVHCSRPIQGTGPSRSGPEAPGLHCPPLAVPGAPSGGRSYSATPPGGARRPRPHESRASARPKSDSTTSAVFLMTARDAS